MGSRKVPEADVAHYLHRGALEGKAKYRPRKSTLGSEFHIRGRFGYIRLTATQQTHCDTTDSLRHNSQAKASEIRQGERHDSLHRGLGAHPLRQARRRICREL